MGEDLAGNIEFYFKSFHHNFVCPHMCVHFCMLRGMRSTKPSSSIIIQYYTGALVCFFICIFSLLPPSFLMPFVLMVPTVIMYFASCSHGENLEDSVHVWSSFVEINVDLNILIWMFSLSLKGKQLGSLKMLLANQMDSKSFPRFKKELLFLKRNTVDPWTTYGLGALTFPPLLAQEWSSICPLELAGDWC